MKKSGLCQLIREDENKYALPNLLTVLRLVFLPFIFYFLYRHSLTGDLLALFFMLLASLTDYLDGHFARKLNKQSQLGRMLDPLIDKLAVGTTMLVLAHIKGMPFWYAGMVIARDLFLLTLGLLVISKKQFIAESNKLGKWTSTIFAMVIITFTLNIPYVKYGLMYLSVLLVPASVIGYLYKYRMHLPRMRNLFKNIFD
ncbi:CDP-alcohol phosphatidyltransferase family protein [candidate division KSB1 bacterium]|nr:CDP-alcohol phosphatidyltransferase family protein [candidate division KSB1 bacterium]RQW10783.1 MAG: CDP-alcohol phosphatidyltransferase family protein [candidate division KSB1 bacterium]